MGPEGSSGWAASAAGAGGAAGADCGSAYVYYLDGCDDGSACTCDQCVGGECEHTNIQFGNVDCSGEVDVDDVMCVVVGFADPLLCPNGDIAPCTPDGFIDLDDILGTMVAFSGSNLCGCLP